MADPNVSYKQGPQQGNDQYQRSDRIQQTQAEVDQVVGIMRDNMEKVLERDQKLSDLDTRAEHLQVGAQQFERHTNRIKRKYWWQNIKMIIILVIVVAVILAIIIGVSVSSSTT